LATAITLVGMAQMYGKAPAGARFASPPGIGVTRAPLWPSFDTQMDRERLDNWCEKGILSLVLAVLVFGPLANGAVEPVEFLVIQGLTTAALALWLVRVWVKGAFRLLWPPVCWTVVAFVAYAVVRYLQADIEWVARRELIRIVVYAALFFVIVNNLHRQEATNLLVAVPLFLAMTVSFYALYQFLMHPGTVWHLLSGLHLQHAAYLKRGSGTYINPNHLAGFLEMVAPFGLAYVFAGRLGHATKVVWGYATLAVLVGIGATVSRGGWTATALSLVLLFFVLMRNRHYRLFALAVLVLLAVGGAFFVIKAEKTQERFKEITHPGSLEASRVALWRPALQMWQEHPWVGVGPGHFDYRFPAYRPPNVQARPLRVHNDYLNTLTDWGVVGFVLVAATFTLAGVGAVRTWKYAQRSQNDFKARQSNRAALVLGACAGLLAILVHSFVDFNLHSPANAILMVTLLAVLTGHMRFASDRHWVSAGPLLRLLVSLMCLAGLYYLGGQGMRRAQELSWLHQAARAKDYSPQAIELLQRAHAVEPKNFRTTYRLGEAYRVQSWQGGEDMIEAAERALEWFRLGMRLNPHDAYNYLRAGMCLDWIGRTNEAAPYFERAAQLDPNGHYTVAHLGWHQINLGNWAKAKEYFERSLELTRRPYRPNPLAQAYLDIVKKRLAETAPR
jgi:O-antigen ligase